MVNKQALIMSNRKHWFLLIVSIDSFYLKYHLLFFPMTQTAEVPLTEHQLDIMLDKLDMDGDGEVDFS